MGSGLLGGSVTEEWTLKCFSPHWQRWEKILSVSPRRGRNGGEVKEMVAHEDVRPENESLV